MVDRVFISYCRSDSDFIDRLERDLEEHQVRVWLDKRDISIGADWPEEIKQALNNSIKLLVVLSPEAVESRWVQNEITYAHNMKKTIVPVLLRDCDIPIQLQTVQFVDFRQTAYNLGRYGEAFQRLLQALQPSPEKKAFGYVSLPEMPKPRESIGVRAVPDLFIRNIFAIPEENPQRDARMRELLSKEYRVLRLLARTGFNYLQDEGKNYQAGFGKHLREGTRIHVLLESPYSQSAEARLRAELGSGRWDKLSPDRLRKLLDSYPRLEIRFTEDPVYCSLFFTSKSVIYDPYHLGRFDWVERVGNHFLVFEFERPPLEHWDSHRDYYTLFEEYFEFLWENRGTKTFKQLCDEHPEELGRFTE